MCNVVLEDEHGRQIDIHSYTLTLRATMSMAYPIRESRSTGKV
ncbi:hypothetical protein [Roseiflexus castenholzii]